MARRTAVIDIGSNSARMVIFERTSRFGFHLLNETRSRVRIAEGAYEQEGYLQPRAIERAKRALAEFLEIARGYKVRKVLCVATSAVRDAPNGKAFVRSVDKELGLKIKVIDGDKEAWLGGVAAVNLLPIDNGITIDIGGGSTELALIRQRRIVQTCSLNLGTVRIKELFFDKKASIDEAKAFIVDVLRQIPETFYARHAIGIGGTIRAVTKAIMTRHDHPVERVHAYTFDLEQERKWIEKIAHAPVMRLGKYGIKKERFDTIRPGALIFLEVLAHIGAKDVMTSGAGVREGLFLSDLLRNSRHLFPANFNPSIRTLLDRFCTDTKLAAAIARSARALFETLREPMGLDQKYGRYLEIAAKLSQIGIGIDFYGFHKHSAYLILNHLYSGFTHEEMILIATLIRFHKRRLPRERFTKPYKKLLPDTATLSWLSYIVSLAQALHRTRMYGDIRCSFKNGVLTITTPFDNYLARERVKELEKPAPIAVRLVYTA